jgi:hypothetical protein
MDGGQGLPRVAEALTGARSYVHIAGWHITPDFGLTRTIKRLGCPICFVIWPSESRSGCCCGPERWCGSSRLLMRLCGGCARS